MLKHMTQHQSIRRQPKLGGERRFYYAWIIPLVSWINTNDGIADAFEHFKEVPLATAYFN